MSESDSTRTEATKKWLPNLKHPSFIGRPASIWLDLGKNKSSAGKIMCNICQTSSETMKAALAHLRSKHKNQKQYECDQCSERFNVFENLQTHKASHEARLSSEGIVKCPIKNCSKEFRRMVVFRHHVQKEHQINDDFHCKTCNFPFPTVFELEQHRLAHVSREKRRLERRKRELKQKLENPPVPDEISNSKQNIPEPPVFPETRELTSIQDELPETPILDPPVQEVMELVREKSKNKRGSVSNSSKKLSTFEDFTFQKPQPLNDALTALDEIVGTISDPVVNASRNQEQPVPKPIRKKVRKSTKQKIPGPLAGPLQVAPLDAIPNPVPAFSAQNDLDFPFASGTWGYEADSAAQYSSQIMPNYGYESVAPGVQPQTPHFDNYMGNIFYGKPKSKSPAHVCNFCGRVFKTARYLRHHLVSHSGVKKHMCTLCGKTFSRISTLTKHKQSVHLKTIFYPCGRCGKHFYRKDTWRRHQIQHQTARNWACPYCYSRFKTRQNCLKHIKTHQATTRDYQLSEGMSHEFFNPDGYFEMNPIGPMTELLQNAQDEGSNQTQGVQDMIPANSSSLMPSKSSKKGLKEGECVASSSSCAQRLHLPTGGATTPIDSILPNLPQTDQDQDSAKNLIIDEILGAELFGSNSNTNSATQSSSLPQTTSSNPVKRDDPQGKKKGLKTCSAQAVTGQESQQLPFDCAESNLPNDNATGETMPVQSSSKPQKQQKAKRVRPKKTSQAKQKNNRQLEIANEETDTDANRAIAQSFDAYSIQADINTATVKKKKEKETNQIKIAEADVDELATVEEVTNQCRIKYNISLSEKYLIDTSKEKITGIPSHSSGERTTKGVYRFHCDDPSCNKSFTKRCDLNRHILTHTGEKPFKCDKCEKRFSLKSTLVKHARRMHSDEKPDKYNCHVCEKRFTDSGGLKRHMRIHTQARPFKCEDCTKVFKRSDQLVRHRKTCEKNLSKENPSTPKSVYVVMTPLCKEMMEMFENEQSAKPASTTN